MGTGPSFTAAPAAAAMSEGTATRSRPASCASPFAAAQPMRSPVKLPGPSPSTMPERSAGRIPSPASAKSTSRTISLAWRRAPCACAPVSLWTGPAPARRPTPRQIACTSVVFPVPSSPESPITAGARSARPSSSPNRLSSCSRHRMADRVSLGLELENLIAQHRRELEVELLGRRLHLLLEQADEGLPLVHVGGAMQRGGRRLGRLRIGHPGGEAYLVHRFHDGARRDAVALVVLPLQFAPPRHLLEGPLHRPGDAVGVEDGLAVAS